MPLTHTTHVKYHIHAQPCVDISGTWAREISHTHATHFSTTYTLHMHTHTLHMSNTTYMHNRIWIYLVRGHVEYHIHTRHISIPRTHYTCTHTHYTCQYHIHAQPYMDISGTWAREISHTHTTHFSTTYTLHMPLTHTTHVKYHIHTQPYMDISGTWAR